MFDLSGKIAFVTGASSGLGEHFARVLARAGASVVAAARREKRLEKLVLEIKSQGDEAAPVALDVADTSSIVKALKFAEETYGTVDLLINNAGISYDDFCLDLTNEQLDNIIDVNVKSIWHLSTAVARKLVDEGKPGSIVNIASIYGMNTAPDLSLYATSKAAVVQMTKSLGLDLWQYGIRVNALCPGYFKTEMNDTFFESEQGQALIRRIPPKRLGQYGELSGPLLLLASDASSFMTATAIPVDGGHTAQLA